jgi:hypothetical protein
MARRWARTSAARPFREARRRETAEWEVMRRLRQGHSEEQLVRAADLYAAHVARLGTPPRRVQSCRRFYGPQGAYLSILARSPVGVQPPEPPRRLRDIPFNIQQRASAWVGIIGGPVHFAPRPNC